MGIMKVTKRQLRRIIREEKTKLLKEQAEIPTVEVIDEGGTLIISPDTATEVEAVIAQAFDVLDDLVLAIESGGYPRSSRQVVIDPRLVNLKEQLEVAVEGLYGAQMQANHIIAGTGG
jgi:hypothetical protein